MALALILTQLPVRSVLGHILNLSGPWFSYLGPRGQGLPRLHSRYQPRLRSSPSPTGENPLPGSLSDLLAVQAVKLGDSLPHCVLAEGPLSSLLSGPSRRGGLLEEEELQSFPFQ